MATTIDHDFAEPRVPQTPERRLWAVCLMDGIREAFEARRQRIQRKGVTMNFDEAWLFDPKPNHVGSFNWICYQLVLDPEVVRELSLRNMAKEGAPDIKVKPKLFEKDERHRALLEWMHERGENVTAQCAAAAFNVGMTTVIAWFSELRAARRVTTFTHNRRRYYTLTKSEITRRKQWTR